MFKTKEALPVETAPKPEFPLDRASGSGGSTGFGVPKGDVGYGHLPHTDLLPYASAQALRWWFVANAAVACRDICLQTRLVEHNATYTFKEVAVRAVECLDSRGEGIAQESVKP